MVQFQSGSIMAQKYNRDESGVQLNTRLSTASQTYGRRPNTQGGVGGYSNRRFVSKGLGYESASKGNQAGFPYDANSFVNFDKQGETFGINGHHIPTALPSSRYDMTAM